MYEQVTRDSERERERERDAIAHVPFVYPNSYN